MSSDHRYKEIIYFIDSSDFLVIYNKFSSISYLWYSKSMMFIDILNCIISIIKTSYNLEVIGGLGIIRRYMVIF